MPDYEDLILARQERIEIEEDGGYMGGCGFNCDSCPDGTWDSELGDWLCGALNMYGEQEAWEDEEALNG